MRYNVKDTATRCYVEQVLARYRKLRGAHFAHICAFYAAQLEG